MNNENIKLDELEELRDTFQLMDEKLESQEIVTPEQIRAATMEKVGMLETGVKTTLIWGYLIGFPLLTLFFHLSRGLSNAALWTAGIFGFISIVINAFILRKVTRKDFVQLDLNTLMTRERRYRRTFLISAAATLLFWIVYGFVFISVTCGIIYTLMLVAMDIPRFNFIKAYKEGLQVSFDVRETLLSRIGKVVRVLLLSICTLALLTGVVFYVIGAFKTFPEVGLDWMFVVIPIALLSAVIAFIPIIINLAKNNILRGMPTISLVGFSIAVAIFVGVFVAKYISGGDKTIFPTLIMLLVAVWILYKSYKRRH